jgi:hypothetical protein
VSFVRSPQFSLLDAVVLDHGSEVLAMDNDGTIQSKGFLRLPAFQQLSIFMKGKTPKKSKEDVCAASSHVSQSACFMKQRSLEIA